MPNNDTIFIVKHDILLQGIDKYSEIIHDRIYYIKNKSLYYIQKNEIILNQYKEKKDITPEGDIISMFSFNENLYILIQKEKYVTIYKKNKKNYKKIYKHLYIKTEQYCTYHNNKYLCFFSKNKHTNKNCIFIIDKKDNIIEYAYNEAIDHIHAVFFDKENIFMAVGDDPHKVVKCEVIDCNENLLEPQKWKFSDLFYYPVYKIFKSGKEILFAEDGRTVLFNLDKNLIFKDIEEQNSGFQIAAQQFLGRPDINVIGTWRRNENHPYACIYIFKYNIQIYKYVDTTIHISNSNPWTGFNLMKCGQNIADEVFMPNTGGGKSVYMKAYSSFDDITNEVDLTQYSISYCKNSITIYDHI